MMLTFGLIALYSVTAMVAIGTLAWQITDAVPKIAGLKVALTNCPQTRELRFSVCETLISPRHGQVVTLPIRVKLVGSSQPLRAAA